VLKGNIKDENAPSAPIVSRLVISDNRDSKESIIVTFLQYLRQISQPYQLWPRKYSDALLYFVLIDVSADETASRTRSMKWEQYNVVVRSWEDCTWDFYLLLQTKNLSIYIHISHVSVWLWHFSGNTELSVKNVWERIEKDLTEVFIDSIFDKPWYTGPSLRIWLFFSWSSTFFPYNKIDKAA
jgi:hypothetical protein